MGVTFEGGDRVIWFENQGGGLFSQYVQIADTDGGLYKLHMADVNGDGTEDALLANEERDRVSYYPNLGGGQWGGEVLVTEHADGCQSVYAADMDLDGDLDILSASSNDDKVAWYENVGSGEFGMQQPFTIGRTSAPRLTRAVIPTEASSHLTPTGTGIWRSLLEPKTAAWTCLET